MTLIKSRKSATKASPIKKARAKAKASAKKPRKKFPPFVPPETKIGPEDIQIRYDKDGSRMVFVQPNFATVACLYKPDEMKRVMAATIARFVEMVKSSEEPNLMVMTAGTAARIGKVEINCEGDALQEAVIKYARMAADSFTEHLVKALSDFPELLLVQVLGTTFGEMRADGFLNFKERDGLTKLWDSFIKAMGKKIKREWNAPKQGGAPIWTERKRAEALEIYNSVKEPLTRAYPDSETRDGKEEWIRLIMELGGYDREEAESRGASPPSDLAVSITGTRLGVTDECGEGEEYLKYQLWLARCEEKARRLAQRTSYDINDLFKMM